MKLYEFNIVNNVFLLTEEQRNEKEAELFSLLSDEDLEALEQELSESLNEVDPSNPNSYRPKGDKLSGGIKARYPGKFGSKTQRTQQDTPQEPEKEPVSVPKIDTIPPKRKDIEVKPNPEPKTDPKPERVAAISSTVKTMPEKQQAALKDKVKAEKKKREKAPKPVKTKSSPGLLKKAVKGLAALALAGAIGSAGLVGLGLASAEYGADYSSEPAAQQTQQQAAAETPEQKEIKRLKSQINKMQMNAEMYAVAFTKRDGFDTDMFGHEISASSTSDNFIYNSLKDGTSLKDIEMKGGNGYYTVQVDVEGPRDVTTVVSFKNYKIDKIKINGKSYNVSEHNYDIRNMPGTK